MNNKHDTRLASMTLPDAIALGTAVASSSPSSKSSSSISGMSSRSGVSLTVAPVVELIDTFPIALASSCSPSASKSGISSISPGFAAESIVAFRPA